jgi:ketosteroid isomerase-like protein
MKELSVMNADRRSILAGFGGTVVALATSSAAAGHAGSTNGSATEVTETYARANAALMQGDIDTWNRLAPISEDFVLMSPFGGKPSRFADYTPERNQRMGRFFRDGTFRQEVVGTYAVDGMIVLATIERCNVAVGDLPKQEWALRVTSVFKREGTQWKLAHRHADPFVEDVSIAESARFARGERELAAK